jgi:hypothetical protein
MTWLSFSDFELQRKRYDECVRNTPEVDVFCSMSSWVLPAQSIYAPGLQPFIWRSENAYCAFMLTALRPGVFCAIPLEVGWGLACPLIGSDPDLTVGALAAALNKASLRPDYVWISGILENGGLHRALSKRFPGQFRLDPEHVCIRRVASLTGGVEGFLGRRSAKFRAELRRSERRLQATDLVIDYCRDGDTETLVRRMVAVEKDSWKGLSDQGVDHGLPLQFYREIIASLLEQGTFRGIFIRSASEDLSFAFGGVEGTLFRGLQLSYKQSHQRLSLGNMAQLSLIRHLVEEGITSYDLGMDMPYKTRWAESTSITQTAMLAI